MIRTWGNSVGKNDHYDFGHTLRVVGSLADDSSLADDRGASPEEAIVERTLIRGQCVLKCFGCHDMTLGVFKDKLFDSCGLAKGNFDRNLIDGPANRNLWSPGLRLGRRPPQAPAGVGVPTALLPPATLAVFSSQRSSPAAFAPLAARRWRGGATAAQSVVLTPQLSKGGTARNKNGRSIRGGGGSSRCSAPPEPPSNRALSAISTFNIIQEE